MLSKQAEPAHAVPALPCAVLHCPAVNKPSLIPGAVDDETGKFSSDMRLCFAHPFPATKIMFMPDKESNRPDLLATTADYLRLWHLTEDGVVLQKLLNNVRTESNCCCSCVNTSQCISACSCMTCLVEAAAWMSCAAPCMWRLLMLHQDCLFSVVLISARWRDCIGIESF